MTKIIIDIDTGEPIEKMVMGITGFISWRRLTRELFPAGGELREDETIVAVEAGAGGIAFCVKKKVGNGRPLGNTEAQRPASRKRRAINETVTQKARHLSAAGS